MLSITRLCGPPIDAAVKQTLLLLFIFEKTTMLAPGFAPSLAWNASLTNYLWRSLHNASLSDSPRLEFSQNDRCVTASSHWPMRPAQSSKLDSEQRRILMQLMFVCSHQWSLAVHNIPGGVEQCIVCWNNPDINWWDVWIKHLTGIKKRVADWTRGLWFPDPPTVRWTWGGLETLHVGFLRWTGVPASAPVTHIDSSTPETLIVINVWENVDGRRRR